MPYYVLSKCVNTPSQHRLYFYAKCAPIHTIAHYYIANTIISDSAIANTSKKEPNRRKRFNFPWETASHRHGLRNMSIWNGSQQQATVQEDEQYRGITYEDISCRQHGTSMAGGAPPPGYSDSRSMVSIRPTKKGWALSQRQSGRPRSPAYVMVPLREEWGRSGFPRRPPNLFSHDNQTVYRFPPDIRFRNEATIPDASFLPCSDI